MSIQITEKENLDEKLKCGFCKKWLTTSPIYYNSSNGSICGPCYQTLEEAENYVRTQNFEELIQHFSFPCINEAFGCKEVLKFNDVDNHEQSCACKPIHCPKCLNWEGNFEQLEFHTTEKHSKHFLNPAIIDFELVKNGTNVFFTQTDDKTFTILLESFEASSKYHLLVMINGVSEVFYRYKLQFYTDDPIDAVTLPLQAVKAYFDLSQTAVEHKNMLVIDLTFLYSVLNNSSSIKLKINVCQEDKIIKDNKPINNANAIISDLSCSICFEYMTPPILMCTVGHSFCGNCCSQMYQCPLCQNKITSCRNYALEKIISNNVKLSCKNKNFGCTFAAMYDSILNHTNNCDYKQMSCSSISLLKCNWKGFSYNFIDHIKEVHQPIDQNSPIKLAIGTTRSYIIIEDNEIFIFCLVVEAINYNYQNTCKFLMQHFPMTTDVKYCYEVVFTNLTLNVPKISFQQCCKKYVLQSASTDYTSIPYDLCKYLINSSVVTFNIKFEKENIKV